jgi:hypothetical protein
MSQLLVAVLNNTSNTIVIWNSEDPANTAEIPAGQVMVVQGTHGHWNIPDCSVEKDFYDHHMEIRPTGSGTALFSFWDDDSANYVLQTCPGTNYGERTTMQGASDLGNGANVMIQVHSVPLAVEAKVVGS